MTTSRTFDPIWEDTIYGQGAHLNKYPFDLVVTFVFRHFPRQTPRGEVRVLEIGCGAGNNLWFVAREGFAAHGLDGSPSAIEFARERFQAEGLQADLRVGDFTRLPYADAMFDLVIDRGALVCCSHEVCLKAVQEVRRVLKPGGKFLFNPYSDRHSSMASGRFGEDGLSHDITTGSVAGVGQLYFSSRREVLTTLGEGWKILSLQHLETREMLESVETTHAEWRVVAEKQ